MAMANSVDLFILGLGFILIYILFLTIYRLFFHPLQHIPGPRLAALSSWYECYFEVWLPGQYPWKIKKLHEEYGPIIRPVPDEIHINDPEFLDVIYALRGRNAIRGGGLLVDLSTLGSLPQEHNEKMT